MKFLLATRNKGKLEEMQQMLSGSAIELVGLDQTAVDEEPEESGLTFAENARIKAREYARLSGLHAIADDSGLEVAALSGRPGVLSARYGGNETDHTAKMQLLLDEIGISGNDDRSARFVSHIAIADATGEIIFEAEGVCDGSIAEAPRGDHGFGYDPIFLPGGYDLSFGELGAEIKSSISHRARAMSKIIRFLRDFA